MRQPGLGGILVLGQVGIRRIQGGVMEFQDDFIRLGNRIGRISQPEAADALVIVHEPGLHIFPMTTDRPQLSIGKMDLGGRRSICIAMPSLNGTKEVGGRNLDE